MHRKTIYIGQIPLELDLLDAEQFAMVALAKLTEAVLGTGPFVDGLQLAPTTPASLNVNLGAGTIFQLENLEQSVWSSLPADLSHSIVKQGILLDAVTLGITPPVTVGYSQVFLIQVQYQDLDTAPQVLPYYNSDFPDVPFSGPEGTGDEQNTVREGIVAVELKAGIASATGTQTAPAADAGWTALWTVTVANGATTITSGNISAVANAPWIDPKLPQVPAAVQSGKWLYAANTGTANNLVATYSPVPAVLTVGMVLRVFVGNAPNSSAMTFNPNGFGASSIVKADGSNMLPGDIQPGMFLELEWTGTTWQAVNFRGSTNKGLVGAANNLKGSSTGAKTALWTADEFVVGSTGGGFMYKVTPFTLSFDGSTTGAGGMDTGVLTGPADICVYAIFSPAAGTLATLGCLSSASNAPW